MFKSEGNFDVTIKEAYMGINNQESLVVVIMVESDDGQSDYWTGELSNEYATGNNAGKTRAELTLACLNRIGWQHGTDISDETLQSMVGCQTTVWIKANEKNCKTYYNIGALGSKSFAPKRADALKVNAMLADVFGHAKPTQALTQAPAKPAQEIVLAVDDNPFA